MSDFDPATYEAVRALIALITDAPACRARVLELQKQADQARDLQARLAAEREAHDRKVEADTAKLDAREAKLRAREVQVASDEEASRPWRQRAAEAAEFSKRNVRGGVVGIDLPHGTSMTREPS